VVEVSDKTNGRTGFRWLSAILQQHRPTRKIVNHDITWRPFSEDLHLKRRVSEGAYSIWIFGQNFSRNRICFCFSNVHLCWNKKMRNGNFCNLSVKVCSHTELINRLLKTRIWNSVLQKRIAEKIQLDPRTLLVVLLRNFRLKNGDLDWCNLNDMIMIIIKCNKRLCRAYKKQQTICTAESFIAFYYYHYHIAHVFTC